MASSHELSKPKAAPSKKALLADGIYIPGAQRRSLSCSCGWAVYASTDEGCARQAAFHLRNKNKPTRAAADRLRKARRRNG